MEKLPMSCDICEPFQRTKSHKATVLSEEMCGNEMSYKLCTW